MSCLPYCIAGVGQSQVSRAEAVENPENGQRVAQRMTAFHPDKTGDLPGLVRLSYSYTKVGIIAINLRPKLKLSASKSRPLAIGVVDISHGLRR